MKLRPLIAAALLAPAVALAAPASRAAANPLDGIQVGGFVGYETDDVSGIALRLDGEIPFRDLAPNVKMSWVGSLGYSHLTDSSFAGVDLSSNVLKIVPAARFTVPLNPQFSVFGDVGLGLAYVSASVSFFDPFLGTVSRSDSSLNLMMRFGVGAWYQATDRLKVGAMLDLDPIFGNFGTSGYGMGSENTFSVLVGMMYRL